VILLLGAALEASSGCNYLYIPDLGRSIWRLEENFVKGGGRRDTIARLVVVVP
jgi:hypothetical protein